MRSDMSAYGVTELTPEEAWAAAGGCGLEIPPIERGIFPIPCPDPEKPNP